MLRSLLIRYRKTEDGAATVEFVVLFPLFIAIVLAVFESGWLMTKYMMLDRGVDMAVRDLRVGKIPNPGHDDIKTAVCDYSKMIRDCDTTLKIQLITLDAANNPPDMNTIQCYDRGVDEDLQVASDFATAGGARSELMFVRACVLVDPILPGIGFGLLLPQATKDANGNWTGGHQMVSYTAFKNEPV